MDQSLKKELARFAARIRIEQMREFKELGFGHAGGALSVSDLLAVLYGAAMNVDPANPGWEDRDRLVVSKGHAGPAVYAALALKGYFPMEWLLTLNKAGTKLPSHCDMTKTPGIDMTTGSLGQGMSTAIGLALGLRLGGKACRVYLVLGDGELNEGQVWEGAMLAAHRKLGNFIASVDKNGKQLDGTTDEVMSLGDIGAKFASFGWRVHTVDGHDVEALFNAIEAAKAGQGDAPAVIVMNTVKGKGVKEIEDTELNHHITVSHEQADRAIAALMSVIEEVG